MAFSMCFTCTRGRRTPDVKQNWRAKHASQLLYSSTPLRFFPYAFKILFECACKLQGRRRYPRNGFSPVLLLSIPCSALTSYSACVFHDTLFFTPHLVRSKSCWKQTSYSFYVQDSAEAHSGQGTLAKRRPPHRAVPPCKGHWLSLTYRHPWHGGYFDISLGELDVRDTTSLQRWCRGGVLWHVPNTCSHSPRANVFFTR